MNNITSSKNLFCISWSFRKGCGEEKKPKMELGATYCHLVGGSRLEGGWEWDPSSSLNRFSKEEWFCSTCFIMVDMPLDLLYVMGPLQHLVRKAIISGPIVFLWQTMHRMTWLYFQSTCWLLFTLKNAQMGEVLWWGFHQTSYFFIASISSIWSGRSSLLWSSSSKPSHWHRYCY
jgi:hypothetical protein